MATLKIRNWDIWQTYRTDRGQPPWIKVHRALMRDTHWIALTDAQRGQLVAIWMLAADHGGVIPASAALIKKLCFMEDEPDLKTLTEQGFIDERRHDDATATPPRRHDDAPEKRREEKTRAGARGFSFSSGNGEGNGLPTAAELIARGEAFPPPPVKKP